MYGIGLGTNIKPPILNRYKSEKKNTLVHLLAELSTQKLDHKTIMPRERVDAKKLFNNIQIATDYRLKKKHALFSRNERICIKTNDLIKELSINNHRKSSNSNLISRKKEEP
jgi:hypothetical protein